MGSFLQISLPHFFTSDYITIVLRSVSVYVFMVIAIRIFGKKELAQLSIIDFVFLLLISNAVQNAMVGPDTSLPGGLIAAGALFGTNYLLKKILFKSKEVSELLQGSSVMLIYKGELQADNLEKAEITIEELEAAIREHGVEKIEQVDLAIFEVDGNISVISHDFQKRSSISSRKKHKIKARIINN